MKLKLKLSLLIFFLLLLCGSSAYMTWDEYCVKFNKDCSDQTRKENYQKRVASWD